MMKLANCAAAVALIAMSGVAGAQDIYYIQTGDYSKIGNISASGFFETSGIGVDTVTGFDITLTQGKQSATLCSSAAFGCTPNDLIVGESGVVDTGKKLTCLTSCLFYDAETSITSPSGFVFAGVNGLQGAEEQYSLNGYQNTTDVPAPPGTFVLAAGKPTSAPEIDPASAASGLTVLLSALAVLLGYKRKTVSA
jgi:hypothetical protein